MSAKKSLTTFAFLISFPLFLAGDEQDATLRNLINDHDLQPITRPETNPAIVNLGRSLFFDQELSGNRNVSCATCHHPSLGSGDGRSLPSGVGGIGLGDARTQEAHREVVPRNAPEVFHRGNSEWTSMFWDSRVAEDHGTFSSPAGDQLPEGFRNVVSIQAMFPVTSRAEMRGNVGDLDINGNTNEIAQIADDDMQAIWNALTERLLSIPAYRQAFQEAYPDLPLDQVGFQHAAQAIGEFEIASFSPTDSGWDRYLAGDDSALSPAAKRGAAHFLGGNCASCHSGNLLTDQEHHNLAVPQLGPGKDASHLDVGRALETGESEDNFAFRTPPLRNVAITGPWFHNGAYVDLEDVVRHHFAPKETLEGYDVDQLPEHLQSEVRLDPTTVSALTESIDALLPTDETLTDEMLEDLTAFLASLTSPSADLMLHLTPNQVLSGLEVETLAASEFELLYDPAIGSLRIDGNEELSLDALFLRIINDAGGDAADFAFALGMAPWASDLDIVLSDELDAQSFLDYRSAPSSLFTAGDEILSLLPTGLDDSDINDHVIAAYRVHGSPTLWIAEVVSVPEPSSKLCWLLGLLPMLSTRRRHDRHESRLLAS